MNEAPSVDQKKMLSEFMGTLAGRALLWHPAIQGVRISLREYNGKLYGRLVVHVGEMHFPLSREIGADQLASVVSQEDFLWGIGDGFVTMIERQERTNG